MKTDARWIPGGMGRRSRTSSFNAISACSGTVRLSEMHQEKCFYCLTPGWNMLLFTAHSGESVYDFQT